MKEKPDYFDVHAHLNFAAYDDDRKKVIERTLEGNTWCINVGTQINTSKRALDIANSYESGIYAIVGLHPIHTSASYHDAQELGEGSQAFTSRGEVFNTDSYLELARENKVVGIGETGLDYFRLEEESIEIQKKIFQAQIALANEVRKPLMLHIRPGKEGEAYKDSYEILKSEAKVKGDVHFFAGTMDEARLFLDLGFFLSFTGVITFAQEYREIVEFTPLSQMMTETDCPYVSPKFHRGKRNEPLYVKEVVEEIAKIKKVNLEKARETLVFNALRFWNL